MHKHDKQKEEKFNKSFVLDEDQLKPKRTHTQNQQLLPTQHTYTAQDPKKSVQSRRQIHPQAQKPAPPPQKTVSRAICAATLSPGRQCSKRRSEIRRDTRRPEARGNKSSPGAALSDSGQNPRKHRRTPRAHGKGKKKDHARRQPAYSRPNTIAATKEEIDENSESSYAEIAAEIRGEFFFLLGLRAEGEEEEGRRR